MKVVRPSSRDEFKKVVEDAKRDGLLVYISSYPCPDCEIFEASLEELGVETSKIVKIDVPDEEWAIEFVLDELAVPGSPSIILPNGKVLDDYDAVELAMKVKKIVEGARV